MGAELKAKSCEGVCYDLVSINVRSAGPKVEPKKSRRMSAPLAESVAFTKKRAANDTEDYFTAD
jgi:hypothetical protein